MKSEMIKIWKKVNGKEIIRQYKQAKVFGFAITEVLRLGFSKKALEIVRLSVQFKIMNKLRKKYKFVLKKNVNECTDDSFVKVQSNYVWVCWLQGMEQAPDIVKLCYKSLLEHMPERNIVVITDNNFVNYVDIPTNIMEKWRNGIITNTHFSDILRLELLIRYGGLWVDATVLCTGRNIPDYIFNSELFFYQTLKPGSDGQSITMSSWLISACTNNRILLAARALLYEYWSNNNKMIDYYLLHDFIHLAAEQYPNEWKRVPKVCNTTPHILLLELFDQYDKERMNDIKAMTCFHKLSYKFAEENLNKEGTYYKNLVNGEL